jgi:hypothetical protein
VTYIFVDGGQLPISLNAMFEAVNFPAGISDLDTRLTNVEGNALSHFLVLEN